MHQIQVSAPEGKGEEVAKLALKVGIEEASVSQVYVHGPDKNKDEVSVQTDTPTAREFLDALMTAKFFNPKNYSFSSQTLPSLITSKRPEKLTNPFNLPITDIYEDSWTRSQITPSFIARSAVSSLLVAYGMIQNDVLTLAAAFLFTPFLEQVMAAGFGLITREWRLAIQAGMALAVSTVITIISGVVVATLTGGPLQYDNFSPLVVNFLISLVVGVVSGLSSSDAAGRRELIGMAAAAQFAVYPAWFGIMLVLGLPDDSLAGQRWLTFLVNVLTILGVSAGVYLAMRYRGDVLKRYSEKVQKGK